MRIRDANEKDLPSCEKLLHLPEFRLFDGEYLSVETLKDFLEKDYFLVAEENEQILGCIIGESLKAKSVFIWYLVIDKKRRSKGLGKKLLQNFEKRIKRKNYDWVFLQTSSHTSEFYLKNEYQQGQLLQEFGKRLKKRTM